MAPPRDIPFACDCGTLTGRVRGGSPSTGTHAACYCRDCRAAELYKGQPDPAPGPVGLFQTAPHRLSLDTGLDHLAVFSFGEKNILRWYADCCGSILFNTVRSPRMAFASIRTDRLAYPEDIGPVVARAFMPGKDGKQHHKGLPRYIFGAVTRMAAARLSGRWKDTPFFDAQTLEPVRPVHVVSPAERKAILPAS